MKPGVTRHPVASTTRSNPCGAPSAPSGARGTTAATHAPSTTTSPEKAGAPVPSTINPFWISVFMDGADAR